VREEVLRERRLERPTSTARQGVEQLACDPDGCCEVAGLFELDEQSAGTTDLPIGTNLGLAAFRAHLRDDELSIPAIEKVAGAVRACVAARIQTAQATIHTIGLAARLTRPRTAPRPAGARADLIFSGWHGVKPTLAIRREQVRPDGFRNRSAPSASRRMVVNVAAARGQRCVLN
jgi:hypothetical protein